MSSENTIIRSPTETGREINSETTSTTTAEMCPECNGRIVSESGERVCSECGLIDTDTSNIDYGPDWRSYPNEGSKNRDDPRRVGMPSTDLLHDKGLSTQIGWKGHDAKGNPLSAERRRQVSRLRTWDERFRTKDAKERTLKTALGEINRMASALGLSRSVNKQAARLFRSAHGEDLLPGNSIEGFASASVYAAIRVNGLPRTLSEVAAVSRVDQTAVTRAYGRINHELSLPAVPVPATAHLPRQARALSLSSEAERKATEILDAALEERPDLASGRDPAALAAAALYLTGLLGGGPKGRNDAYRTQAEIADTVDTTTVTIRNRYQELAAAVPWLPDHGSD